MAALSEYENAGKLTIKRKQALDKVRAQGRQDKIDLAVKELDEAKAAEDNTRDFLKRVGDTIRDTEWPILLETKDKEFKASLVASARALLVLEKQKLQEIESASRELNQQ